MFGLTNIINHFSGKRRSESESVNEPESKTPETDHLGSSFSDMPRWFRFLAAVVFILWILGSFSKFFFFKRYLPSHVWLLAGEPYITIFGIAAALTCSVCAFLGFQDEERRTGKNRDGFSLACTLMFGFFLFYIPTVDLIRRGIPAMIAVAWGERVEHPYVVEEADRVGQKRCRRPIELRDMPILTQLCYMPQELRDQLQPGMPVIFIGKGTWMGLFVEDFRKP